MLDLKSIHNKHLIILNGQLKYYKYTLSYWKQLSIKNDCHILLITNSNINYKNNTSETLDLNVLKDFSFIEITPSIHKHLLDEIKIIYSSIKKHNLKYNQDHDINSYSDFKYLIRCLYRQLSTIYAIDNLIVKDCMDTFHKVLYARSDFLLYDGENNFDLENKCYSLDITNKIFKLPDIKKERNFSISDYMFWCSWTVLRKYLDAYIFNFYKLRWKDCIIYPQVEAQSCQIRNHLNKTLSIDDKLIDIYDYKNNLFSFNYFYDTPELKIRLHRVKTKEQFDKSILSLHHKTISSFVYYYFHSSMLNDFDKSMLENKKEIIELVKNRNLIIKLNMSSFLLEYKSLNYTNVNTCYFEDVCKLTLFLLELKKINPNIKIIIHTIDLHRMNWELFMYYIKLLDIQYIFMMYIPWFVRQICHRYSLKDYSKQKMMSYVEKYDPLSFKLLFYPRYLWKTQSILNKLYKKQKEKPVKLYDILFYGCIDPKVIPDPITKEVLSKEPYINMNEYYEFRKRLYRLLKNRNEFKPYKIKIIEWVSKHDSSGTYDTDLFHIISQSKFVIATNANVQYLVRKYYEIPMADSIIIGNIPDYAPQIMKDNIINIRMSMEDDKIINIIKHSIHHYEDIKIKHNLGEKLIEACSLYKNDNQYMEDSIHYEETKIKTHRLNTFMNIMGIPNIKDLPLEYQGDH